MLLLIFSTLCSAQNNLPEETDAQKAERMKWWTEARFGLFIHWGLYALPARHEWVKEMEQITDEAYQKYFDYFNPDLFNPKEWARAAKKAGMKYFVVTTKHHEGFCLWDSKYTDYKVTNTPYAKDLINPMVEAFRSEGIRIGFYYSLLDWHHPEYTIDRNHPMYEKWDIQEINQKRDMAKYRNYVQNQLRELLTQFGPIDCLFLDYSFTGGKDGKGRDDWKSVELLKLVRKLQPHIIINDRLDLLDSPGGWDFRTPEQFKPREWVTMNGRKVPWETCQTFSGSWGYHRDENTWKSVKQLLDLLIETVSKGGNLLLNVGPTARGTFDMRAIERLSGLGEWMQKNGRSIYGCTQAPVSYPSPENCLLTYNPDSNRLYIHILDWPMGKLFLNGYKGKIKYAQFLHDGSEVQFVKGRRSPVLAETVSDDTVILGLPIQKPDVEIPVIELFLN